MLWLWLLLLIPIVVIGLSVYFDRKRKSQPNVNLAKEDPAAYEELYRNEGAGKKATDPKHSKNF